MKILLYCTKAKPYLADFKGEYQIYSNGKELDELWDKGFNLNDIMNILNGKIVAECDYEVEKITTFKDYTGYEEYDIHYQTAKRDYERLLQETCLNNQQLDDYLLGENGYAIHIKNLHIFDSPKFLEGFDDNKCHTLRKAPQNMCKVLRVKIGDYDYKDLNSKSYEPYILISIRPEWLCKILNGEKTIEVRKKVLKEMLKNE